MKIYEIFDERSREDKLKSAQKTVGKQAKMMGKVNKEIAHPAMKNAKKNAKSYDDANKKAREMEEDAAEMNKEAEEYRKGSLRGDFFYSGWG